MRKFLSEEKISALQKIFLGNFNFSAQNKKFAANFWRLF